MRAVVMGYHEMGAVGLEAVLRNGFEVPLVVTHPDDPKEEKWFRSVREIAEKAGAPVLMLEEPNSPEYIQRIADAKPDVIFSFYFRKMISPKILELAKDGAFNLHGSLLPKYRGRAPVNWVLVNGETETGVTLHVMDPKPDHGEIVAQRRVEITYEDTALTLYRKLAGVAREILDDALPKIRERRTPKRVQSHSASSYYGGRKPEDGRIHWDWPAERVRNLVRAVTKPWPGAFTTLSGKKLILWTATVAPWKGPGDPPAPGTVVPHDGRVAIVTGDGLIVPGEIEAAELRPGARLGEETA